MKVTIERSVLLKALGHVHRIVERRNTIPILANVLIEAADGSGFQYLRLSKTIRIMVWHARTMRQEARHG